MTAGQHVTADVSGVVFAGVILGFNASGLSAAIRLTADAPGYPEGTEVPIPVRLLEAA